MHPQCPHLHRTPLGLPTPALIFDILIIKHAYTCIHIMHRHHASLWITAIELYVCNFKKNKADMQSHTNM